MLDLELKPGINYTVYKVGRNDGLKRYATFPTKPPLWVWKQCRRADVVGKRASISATAWRRSINVNYTPLGLLHVPL